MLTDSVVLAVFWALLFTDPFYADFGSSFQQLLLLLALLSFAAEDCWHFCWLRMFYLFFVKSAMSVLLSLSFTFVFSVLSCCSHCWIFCCHHADRCDRLKGCMCSCCAQRSSALT